MQLSHSRAVLTGLTFLLCMACSPQPKGTLPDDPSNEPTPIADGNPDATSPPKSPVPTPQPPVTEPPPATLPDEGPQLSYFVEPNYSLSQKTQILAEYNQLDKEHLVPTSLLEKAVLYFHKNKHLIKNQAFLSVIDFAMRSNLNRFFIINMSTGSTWAIHVAHGKGSDPDHDGYATSFSNVSGSNATSLGAYLASETYSGEHGYSMRLDGLSSTNSNARDRAIVVHAASYVQDDNVIQGRSWGCPAVSEANRTKVIDSLKGGSLIYAGLAP